MASSSASFTDTIAVWLPPGALILGPLIFLVLVAAAFANTGPNARGTSPSQPYTSAPSSPLHQILGDFTRYEDPSFYLQQNSQQLAQMKAQIQALDAQIQNGVSYKGLTGDQATQVKTILDQMVTECSNIQTEVGSGNANAATKDVNALIANWKKLDSITAGNGAAIAAAAAKLAEENKNGNGPITYRRVRPIEAGTSGYPQYLDCSGFVSYVLQETKVFKVTEAPDVSSFYTQYAKDPRFSIVAQAVGGRIPDDTVKADLQPGDIILTSSGTIAQSYASDNVNHAVIYLGPGYSEGDIAESTDEKGKNGPQFDTLADRLSKSAGSSPIQLILRVVGTTNSSNSTGSTNSTSTTNSTNS